ncbi:hypothetical protein B296_00031152 [Ensete ventricosum]|uniref:Uncharacterized protein n=1 Tax=Ensete ventricosum TaxID=4639 RepID=A0A426YKX2_ENSVE|nr:hypothetical protein B296_00031152 [Ensete ventricosum]
MRRFVSHCSNKEEFNTAVSDILQLSEKGRVGGRTFKWLRGKFKWLRGLLATKEAGSAVVRRSGLNYFGTKENSREFGQEQRKTTESSVLCSAGLGEHERRSREVDLCS